MENKIAAIHQQINVQSLGDYRRGRKDGERYGSKSNAQYLKRLIKFLLQCA